MFYINMGHNDSYDEYNDTKERQRNIKDKYDEDKGFEWNWDTSANRIIYDKIRIKSAIFDKYSKFAISGLILHRLISFIDIIYLERRNIPVSLNTYINRDYQSIQLNINLELSNFK